MTTNRNHSSSSRLVARWCAILFGTVWMVAGLGIHAQAQDGVVQAAAYVADEADQGVQQVGYTYSVGDSGHRFKWKAYESKRTTKVVPLRAEAAQHLEPALPQPDELPPLHPMDDPYGDMQLPEPSEEPSLPGLGPFSADSSDSSLPSLGESLDPPTTAADSADLPPLGTMPLSETPQFDMPPSEIDDPNMENLLVDPRKGSSEKYLAECTQECEDCPDCGDEEGRKKCIEKCARCKEQCKYSPDDILKPLNRLDHGIGIRDPQIKSPDYRPCVCDLAGGEFMPRQWAPTTFMWQASGLCHKPAYFEDVHLERYGHSWGPYVQPLMSGAHFFLNVPVLPYKMGLYPPNECIYTLGYYRPGSCAPYMLDPLPLSVRAGLAQAGAVVGMAYLIP